MGLAFVSVIMPCRNEKAYIEGVVHSVFAQDYPSEHLEVIVADGMSDDGTREKLEQLAETYPQLKVIDNPNRITPHALNVAIEASKGDVIVRFDAHAIYPSNYISELVMALDELGADNVGGVLITRPVNDSLKAQAIALAISSKFGVGNADFRTGASTVSQVDTVPFGCFRRSVFEELGLFDPDLVRNQDDEFNARMIQAGKKIFLIPDVKIEYFARATYSKLALMYYQYGLFKPLVNRKLNHPATLRQFVPLLFVLSLLAFPFTYFSGILQFFWACMYVLYFVMSLAFSIRIALARKSLILTPHLVSAFFLIHFSYGWGYIKGIFRFIIFDKKMNSDQTHLSR